MSRDLFLRIMNAVESYDDCFVQKGMQQMFLD
jgi:hypothetical protein